MTVPDILMQWFAVTRVQARIAARLYEANGEVVPAPELCDLCSQSRQGLDWALQKLRAAMDPGAIINDPGVGYRMSWAGLKDCRAALADAERRGERAA